MADRATARALEGFPDRPSLRRALRHALRNLVPELRVIAEGFLAEISTIDLLAVGGDGELVAIRFADADDDAAALTRSLADLSWLRPRRSDLLKLATGLGIEPSAEPRLLLVCRDFGPETRAAADNFPAETVQLWRSRGLHRHGQSSLLIERLDHGPAQPTTQPTTHPSTQPTSQPTTQPTLRPETRPDRHPAGAARDGRAADPSALPSAAAEPARRPERPERIERGRPLIAPPNASAFRTGLVDTDLERKAEIGAAPRRPTAPDVDLFPG